MSDTRWIWQFERDIPSDPGAGRLLLKEVLAELESRCWSERDRFGIHLAAEEALINAIAHGNRYNLQKRVRLVCRLAEDLVHIEISDEGYGFDPESLPDPTDPDRVEACGGRGVLLMKTYMSRVEFRQRGRHVVMQKWRSCEKSEAGPGRAC
jgi:serine/threonine-protein kinase RsbW